MTGIRLYNTRTRTKEDFAPLDPANVRMYVCGPTVYDRAHLGNARPVVVFDVLFRLLRHVYGADHVTYVRNFTDVDDKINAAALARQKAGDERSLEALIAERTEETIGWYHADMDALGALRPASGPRPGLDCEPRATAFIPQMVAMTESLIARGHAYAAEGHVLFAVRSFNDAEGRALYGKLSGRSVDDMIAGARVEVAPYKRDPMDFVLWKPSSEEEPGWPSPWGRGRPGWHIECSAMALELLGETFDIHAGGMDLQFPHHENEIAQSCCALADEGDPSGAGKFARVWLHNEMLQVEGKKMSKSLGNFFTVRDLLDQGVPGEVIRLVMLGTHYSKPMDWTAEKAREAINLLRTWATVADDNVVGTIDPEVLEAIADDLNTWEAIERLRELFKDDERAMLAGSLLLLGIDINAVAKSEWAMPFHFALPDGQYWEQGVDFQATVGVIGWGHISEEVSEASAKLVLRWLAKRKKKDWISADQLKNVANSLGVELRATRSANGINGGIASLHGEVDARKLAELVQ